MEVGDGWNVVDTSTSTSASLPVALWHEEACYATSSADKPIGGNDDPEKVAPVQDKRQNGHGFFLALLQRWDVSSDDEKLKSVYFQLIPMPDPEGDCSSQYTIVEKPATINNDDDDVLEEKAAPKCLAAGPVLRVRLPKTLAICEKRGHSSASSTASSSSTSSTTVLQQRRVPILIRLAPNRQLMAMQFSPTHIRIVEVEEMNNKRSGSGETNSNATSHGGASPIPPTHKHNPKHWTIELMSLGDKYAPMVSAPNSMPKNLHTTSRSSNTSETILPGGIYWLGSGAKHCQELIFVTTTSLLCYKVELHSSTLQLTVSLVHVFAHPPASAVWWTPKSRVIVVGSYEATKRHKPSQQPAEYPRLFLRTVFLDPLRSVSNSERSVFFLPLQFQRPPPTIKPPFPVGDHALYPATATSLVHLYGRPFLVEVGAAASNGKYGEHSIDICFHRIDCDACKVQQRFLKQKVDFPKKIHIVKEDILITTLENVLCVVFRRSKLLLFLDIKDTGSQCSYVMEKMTETECSLLVHQPRVSCLSPSYVFTPQSGMLVPVKLDLERLAPSLLKHGRCNFSFLLRRRQIGVSQRRDIALSRFAAVGALRDIEKRQLWIHHVAFAYAQSTAMKGSEKRASLNPLQWDMQVTLPLIFRCALLGTDLRFEGMDAKDGNVLFDDDMSSRLRNCAGDAPPQKPVVAVLFQKEILEQVLLPKVEEALCSGVDSCGATALLLGRVADVAIAYMGALENYGTTPCPALECFIVVVLWRLGCNQEISAMLRSRRNGQQSTSLPRCRRSREIMFLGNELLLVVILQIVEAQSRQGAQCRVADLTTVNMLVQDALALFSDRVGPHPRCATRVLKVLLSLNRVTDALAFGYKLLAPVDGDPDEPPDACVVHSRRQIDASCYLKATMRCNARHCWSNPAACERLVGSVHRFLERWDPEIFQQVPSGVRELTKLCGTHATYNHSRWSSGVTTIITRRPSWISLALIDKVGTTQNWSSPLLHNSRYCQDSPI